MEFSSRGFQRSGRPSGASPAPSVGGSDGDKPGGTDNKKPLKKLSGSKASSILTTILFVAVVILIIAMVASLFTRTSEAALIDEDKYQAVFLNNSQVYFGKVTDLNNRFINLQDVFYLNVGDQNVQPETQSSAQDISLVKLGCELHGPQDQMIIYRDQVTFWENLKDDGQVTTAIQSWIEQNPEGQNCDNQTQTQQQQESNTTNDNTKQDSSTTPDTNDTDDTPPASNPDSTTTSPSTTP